MLVSCRSSLAWNTYMYISIYIHTSCLYIRYLCTCHTWIFGIEVSNDVFFQCVAVPTCGWVCVRAGKTASMVRRGVARCWGRRCPLTRKMTKHETWPSAHLVDHIRPSCRRRWETNVAANPKRLNYHVYILDSKYLDPMVCVIVL